MRIKRLCKRDRSTVAALLVIAAVPLWAQRPVLSSGGPDAAALGSAQQFPVGTAANFFEKQYLVGSLSHFDEIFPGRTVSPAAHAWEFQRPASPPAIVYRHAGNRYTLDEYLSHLPVTGLLIAKDDQILYEGYQYGRTDQERFTSQSMAKSIVGMLTGVALAEHALGSLTDRAGQYVPELKNSDYGKATLRDLLHMSSGVDCQTQESSDGDQVTLSKLVSDCKQAAPAGTRFHYSAADSQVLGLAITRATKMPLARYLQEKIWHEIGTESKATWTTDRTGQELAYCCFNATLRDYARLARLLAFEGVWNGKQVIPAQWISDASTIQSSDPQLAPGKPVPFFGYGYQLWIFPGPERMFGLLGANGQRIFVDPHSKLILVQTAAMEKAMDPPRDAEMIGLWLSLVHRYGSE